MVAGCWLASPAPASSSPKRPCRTRSRSPGKPWRRSTRGSARFWSPCSASCAERIEHQGTKMSDSLMLDDLRHLGGRRRVAAALGAHDAVDDGHADAREVAELHALEDVLAGGMLRSVHDDEVGRAADLDQAAVERAHPRGVAGGETERDLGRHLAER